MRVLRLLRMPFDWLIVMLTPACDRIVREASDQLDGVEATRWQRFYIQIHLMCCKVCDDYVRNIRTLGRALRRLAGRANLDDDRPAAEEPAPVGPGLSDSARDRLIAHLKRHHSAEPPNADPSRES